MADKFLNCDCMEGMKAYPDESVSCCVTSPPYYGLRDYGVPVQIGLETTPEEYISRLVDVFREVKRLLRGDGTLWLNIGDSYAGSRKSAARYPDDARKHLQGTNKGSVGCDAITRTQYDRSSKNLLGIPWRVALALQDDGWILRSDIIWAKPNPMPESVRDRPTKSHEYIFLFSKSQKYFYDAEAIAEPIADSTAADKRFSSDGYSCGRPERGYPKAAQQGSGALKPRYGGKKYTGTPELFFRTKSGNIYDRRPFRNKRDVWFIATAAYKNAHFATFPEKLVEPCILAGCPEGGIVLDPFIGSGTVAFVAEKLDRQWLGFDINPDYIAIARQRLDELTAQPTLGYFRYEGE